MSDCEETTIKEEPMDEDSEEFSNEQQEEPPKLNLATYGLHPVGTVLPPKPQPKRPIQLLNARGMPARIRKKNKLFFDDDIVNDSKSFKAGTSPRKGSKSISPLKSPSKHLKKKKNTMSPYIKAKEQDKSGDMTESPRSVYSGVPFDKKIGQQIGLRLRNLLKLPMAHKWVSFEWFYSSLDRALFDGENDFQICLREMFPQLKSRNLTRKEWSKLRSMMGKPRRFSEKFLKEECDELERLRQKVRILQTTKSCDSNYSKGLPSEIPLQLPVGSKVTAWLRQKPEGLYIGTVDAIDSLTSTYRITFDRPELGTHSIPDYEVWGNDFNETVSLNCLTQDFRPKFFLNGVQNSSPARSRNILNKSDPLLSQDVYDNQFKNPVLNREKMGGFPVKFLELIINLKKTLSFKVSKLQRVRDMNTEAEKQKSFGERYSEDFQRRYANLVISIEKLNKDIQNCINQIQSYACELTKEPHLLAMLAPSYLREKCREQAEEAVQRNNQNAITDENIISLINDLATLMLVASNICSSENTQVLKTFDGCIEEVKNRLDAENVEVFQKKVQIHLHHIQLDLGQHVLTRNKTGVGTSSNK